MRYVLSTAPIIRQFREFERLFEFHENGIRGLIEASLLGVADTLIKPYTHTAYEVLIDKVLAKYEASVQYRELEYSYPDSQPSITIEYVVGMITVAMNAMMQNVFMDYPYEVKSHQLTWLGDDIVVVVIIHGMPSCQTRL